MGVNLRKFMQLIVLFSHSAVVKPLGKTKLFKLLYFADITHLRRTGHSITSVEYLKYPYGPVPVQGDFALRELKLNRYLSMERITLPNGRFRRDISALKPPDMSVFTQEELLTIDDVIRQYGRDSAAVLSWRSHMEAAWLFADDWRPLQLDPEKDNSEPDEKNADAIAWLEQWYATPDDQPPGYWDELEEILKAHPITFDSLED